MLQRYKENKKMAVSGQIRGRFSEISLYLITFKTLHKILRKFYNNTRNQHGSVNNKYLNTFSSANVVDCGKAVDTIYLDFNKLLFIYLI